MQEPTLILIVGILVILAAWIPLFLGRFPVSLPMIAVAVGAVLAACTSEGNPLGEQTEMMRKLAEFALLVSVLGAGLKIDRRFSFRRWTSTWRLLGVVMLISIAAVGTVAHYLLGFSLGLSILVGAMLAPTDPVLASDFSTGPPGSGEDLETKFALTSEAGLNDGLAFPFVMLGLAVIGGKLETTADIAHWLAIELVWDVLAGAAIGIALGWILVRINAWLPKHMRLSASNSGLVSIGLSFLAYAMASYIGGNGFVAVFCEAAAIRNFANVVDYSRRLNHAAEQFERIAMVLVLAMLGVATVRGLFDSVGWPEIAFMFVVLLGIRPFAVALGFIGSREDKWTRANLGYFGIRGVASLYYAAYIAPKIEGGNAHQLTVVIGLVILASVVLYGTTAHWVGSLLSGGDAFEE